MKAASRFTLTEVMAVAFILGVIALVSMRLYTQGAVSLGNARNEAMAFELACEGVEWFSNLPFGLLENFLSDPTLRETAERRFGLVINRPAQPIGPYSDQHGRIFHYFDEKLQEQPGFQKDYYRICFRRQVLLERADADTLLIRSRVLYIENRKERVIEIASLSTRPFFK